MENQFCIKRLDNFWDDVTTPRSRSRFLIRVVLGDCVAVNLHATFCPDGSGAVAVRLIADDNLDYVTDGVADSIYEDATRLARHYFPGCGEIRCRATFGKTTVNREWSINKVVKERGLSCK